MKILSHTEALKLLDELKVCRIAGFDQERHAMYAVPLRFAIDRDTLLIVVQRGNRLDHVISRQHRGLCIEADDVRPNWTFRSVIGTVTAETLHDSTPALVALAQRYGAQWGTWRPNDPVQAYRLHFTDLQARDTTGD